MRLLRNGEKSPLHGFFLQIFLLNPIQDISVVNLLDWNQNKFSISRVELPCSSVPLQASLDLHKVLLNKFRDLEE